MKKNSLRIVCFLALLLLPLFIQGCGPNGVGPIIPLKAGEMEATISGFGDFFATDTQVTDGGSTYTIIASQYTSTDSVSVTILVTKLSSTPYAIDFSTDKVTQMVYCKIQHDGTCSKYSVQKGVGSGTLRITSTSPDVEGEFSGSFVGTGGTVTITGGRFNASF